MNIAIYSRKSMFIEGSESLENQIQICKSYIQSKVIDVQSVFIYEDEGFSGGNTKRPKFQKMIKDLKSKKFNMLVCYKLDRISRNVADFSNTLELFQKYDVSFVSVSEQFDTSTPMGKAMVYIASVFAQLERETIAERVRDNMMELAKTGRWLGGNAPIGYVLYGKKQKATFKIDPHYSKIVKNMYSVFLERGTMHDVLKWGIEDNVKRPDGKSFTIKTLSFILHNPTYCIADSDFYDYAKEQKMKIANSKEEFAKNKTKGVMPYNRTTGQPKKKTKPVNEWVVAIGLHEGIIDSTTWIKAQRIIKKNKNAYPRSGTSGTALLGGMIKCTNCGSNMKIIYTYKNGKKDKHYYKCFKKVETHGNGCAIKNINGAKIEKEVIDYIINLAYNKDVLNASYKKHTKSTNINIEESNINIIKSEIKQNKVDIENLTTKLLEAGDSPAVKYILQKIEKLDLEIQELEKSLSKSNDNILTSKQKEQDFLNLYNNMKFMADNIQYLDVDKKKYLIKAIIKEIWWDGKTTKITLNFF